MTFTDYTYLKFLFKTTIYFHISILIKCLKICHTKIDYIFNVLVMVIWKLNFKIFSIIRKHEVLMGQSNKICAKYAENCTTLIRNEGRWTGKPSTIKLSIVHNLIYRIKAILIKIQEKFVL